MRAQAAARAIGILLGLQCTLNPLLGNTAWQHLPRLPLADQLPKMASTPRKERVLACASSEGRGLLTAFDKMFEPGDPPDYEPPPFLERGGKSRTRGA